MRAGTPWSGDWSITYTQENHAKPTTLYLRDQVMVTVCPIVCIAPPGGARSGFVLYVYQHKSNNPAELFLNRSLKECSSASLRTTR